MSTNEKFTDEQLKIIGKVEKLLRLAAKNPNENEAAAAQARAMELMEAYNLSADAMDIDGETSGKRAEEKMIGGFYQYERDMWSAIAELNFCWYWSQNKFIPADERHKHRGRVQTRQHVLIGKVVNIAATKAMAGYLAQTIERMTKELCDKHNEVSRSSFAVSYRRGIAERVIEKINQRRWDILDREQKAQAEAAKRAAEAGVSQVETALTLKGVEEREYEANYDFRAGKKGAYAEMKRSQAEREQRRAKAQAEAEAAYTKWAEAHPEEAARAEAERIKRARRSSGRRGRSYSAPAFKGDWNAYAMGREAGKNVGIDPQAKGGVTKGRLG